MKAATLSGFYEIVDCHITELQYHLRDVTEYSNHLKTDIFLGIEEIIISNRAVVQERRKILPVPRYGNQTKKAILLETDVGETGAQ